MEEIIYYLSQLFSFILTFFLIIILLFIIFKISLRKHKITDGKIKIYGIFMGLQNNEILSMGILTIKYIFIIWCVTGTTEQNYVYLLVMVILGILYNLLNNRFVNLLFDILNIGVIYVALTCKNLFFNYLNEVMFEWYVLLFGILVSLFVVLYVSYFFIKDLDYILKGNKHVKKKLENKKGTHENEKRDK